MIGPAPARKGTGFFTPLTFRTPAVSPAAGQQGASQSNAGRQSQAGRQSAQAERQAGGYIPQDTVLSTTQQNKSAALTEQSDEEVHV
jgi:hypothetical protein